MQWETGTTLAETLALADIEAEKSKARRQERLAIGALAVLGLFAVTR